MVAQLYLYILIYGGLIVGGLWGTAHLVKAAKRRHRRPELEEAERRKALGARNALLLKAKVDEVCIYCGEPVDPKRDAYDEDIPGWTHPECYIKATRI